MPKTEPHGVAVFTAAPPKHERALYNFACDLCENKKIVLITVKDLEIGLLDDGTYDVSPQERFQIRELVQSFAANVAHNGYRIGAIVPFVTCDEYEPDFDHCVTLLRDEREAIRRWGLFRELHTACLLPDGRVVPVTL